MRADPKPNRSERRAISRTARLEYVPLEKMRVREGISQRDFKPHWADQLSAMFDPDKFQTPKVNRVGAWYWIVDGQHRIAALKNWLGEWEGQQIECWVVEGLSEKEEARLFDVMNNTKQVSTFDKFRIRVTAEDPDETNVQAIVHLHKLKISKRKEPGAISCVGTLLKVYRRSPDCLSRTLKAAYYSFGDAGLDADVIDGLGALMGRYDGQVDDERLVKVLKELHQGVATLRQRAVRVNASFGGSKAHSIAAVCVDAYNRGLRGKKLPSWWKTEA